MNTIQDLANLIEKETRERYISDGFTHEVHEPNLIVTVIPGKKYTKINIGSSGKYMIENDMIYGIKAYNVINKKKQYGTLDTIHDFYWGLYTALAKIK